jgi:hypothetical protein
MLVILPFVYRQQILAHTSGSAAAGGEVNRCRSACYFCTDFSWEESMRGRLRYEKKMGRDHEHRDLKKRR